MLACRLAAAARPCVPRRCLLRRSIFTTAVERVEHITLIRAERAPLDRMDATEMQDRLAKVPGVISASVGAASSSAPEYNVAIVVRLLDDAALNAFRDHPDVKAVHESLTGPPEQEGQNSSSRLEASFKFTHNAVLRPLPAILLGAVSGGVGGFGLGLLV